MTIRYFEPKKQLTLYDSRTDKEFRGVLYFAGSNTKNELNQTSMVSSPSGVYSKPQVLISENEKPNNHRPFRHNNPRSHWLRNKYYKKRNKNTILKSLAILCLTLSVVGFGSIGLPVAISEASFRIDKAFGSDTTNNFSTQSEPVLNHKNTFFQNKHESTEFTISIPKVNLVSAVVPNVDASDKNIYTKELKKGIAHAKGSYLPGEKGTVILFAHSTDSPLNILEYNAKFYVLKDLNIGDNISISYHGELYKYKVSDKQLSKPDDLTKVRESKAGLILQTCWPPGTNWKRLLIFANQI